MPWILKLKLDWILLRKQLEGARQFKAISRAQSNARIIAEGDESEKNDIFAALMKSQDPETARTFSTAELVSEGGLLIIAGRSIAAPERSAAERLCSLGHFKDRNDGDAVLCDP